MDDKKKVNFALQQDTDILILEYLIYNATNAILEFRQNEIHETELGNDQTANKAIQEAISNHLRMVESFLIIFNNEHAGQTSTRLSLTFHLALLRFTTLFGLRHSSLRHLAQPAPDSLAASRHRHQVRAKRWCETYGTGTFIAELERQGNKLLSHVPSPVDSVGLIDLVPHFIWLTALRVKLGGSQNSPSPVNDNDDGDEMASQSSSASSSVRWEPSEKWIALAQEFMLQAFLEQVVEHHREEYAPLVEAFSWGVDPATNPPPYDDDVDMEAGTARNSDFEPLAPRDMHALLKPVQGLNRLMNYHNWVGIRSAHPEKRFEAEVLGFLNGLIVSVPPPVLVQLEQGGRELDINEGDGSGRQVKVGEEEVEALRKLAGLNLGS